MIDTPRWTENRLSIVPCYEEFNSLPGRWLYMPGDGPAVSSWRALDAVLYAAIGPEDTGPRSGDGAAYQETMVASGKLHLTIGQAWLVGLFVSGEKRLAGSQGTSAARFSIDEYGLLAFYWALADIDSVAAVRTKKYLKLWDNVFYVESSEPRAVLELQILAPQGPERDWAISRGMKGTAGQTSSMTGLLASLTEQISRARNTSPRWQTETDGQDETTIAEFSPTDRAGPRDGVGRGWFVDPGGRFERRWSDGAGWSRFVWTEDNGFDSDNAGATDPPSPPATEVRPHEATAPGEPAGAADVEDGGAQGEHDPDGGGPADVSTTGTPELASPRPSAGFCTQCGTPLSGQWQFCGACGASTTEPADTHPKPSGGDDEPREGPVSPNGPAPAPEGLAPGRRDAGGGDQETAAGPPVTSAASPAGSRRRRLAVFAALAIGVVVALGIGRLLSGSDSAEPEIAAGPALPVGVIDRIPVGVEPFDVVSRVKNLAQFRAGWV